MGARVITLLRFHLATAVPASLRALAPVAAAVTVGIMLQPTPSAAVIAIVVAVVGAVDLPLVSLLVVVAALALARAVGGRLAPRRDDWLGHLPATAAERRVAAAVAAALGPALAVAAVAILAAPVAAGGFEIRPLRLAGLVAVCLPAGAFGILTRRSRLAGPAAVAAWLTLETGPVGLVIGPLAAVVLVALARPAGHSPRLRALPLPPMLAITLRATGLRLLVGAASGALLAGCAAVFATTNELPAWIVDRAAVLASLLGVVAAATAAAEVIARRRPAWPWARALPWSARRRVLGGDRADGRRRRAARRLARATLGGRSRAAPVGGHPRSATGVRSRGGEPMISEYRIECHGIGFRYDDTPVLDGAELAIGHGLSLRLVCRLRSRPLSEGRELLARLGLGELRRASIRELSMGQRRRAVLAAAFVGEPALVLCDEPLESLDAAARELLLDWLDERLAAGAAVVVATHRLEPFIARATRAIDVRAGQVRLHDPLPATSAERERLLRALARGDG